VPILFVGDSTKVPTHDLALQVCCYLAGKKLELFGKGHCKLWLLAAQLLTPKYSDTGLHVPFVFIVILLCRCGIS